MMSLQRRQSSIARRSLLAAAVSLVLAACEGSGGTTGEGAAGTPAATTEPTSQADPLEGEWRAEFTCKESLRAIESRLAPRQIREQVGSLGSFMEAGGYGAEPTEDDPCHGATKTAGLLVRFADGTLALLNPESGEVEAQATYELVDDRSISVSDEEGNLCSGTKPPTACPVTWEFDVTGNEVAFHVTPDAFVISAWEAAPFHRVS
jgi:hypothetical protein